MESAEYVKKEQMLLLMQGTLYENRCYV